MTEPQLGTKIDTYSCFCEEDKIFRLTYDGGNQDRYAIRLCQKCYDLESKEYMISEELMK